MLGTRGHGWGREYNTREMDKKWGNVANQGLWVGDGIPHIFLPVIYS